MSGFCRNAKRNTAAATLLAAGAMAALAGPHGSARAADALYGLVVGVDDYSGTANDLQGAVNDARDIADALNRAGARQIMLLTDRDATKSAIEAGWKWLVDKADATDTIVFSYAGHGGQEPEPPGRNGEADGLNENFILAGYTKSGPGSRERIVDDEINAWLKAADAKGIEVVFVADSCHSGTMFRSAGSKTVRYRTGTFEDPDLAGDLLALPDPSAAAITENEFRSVTFIAATQDNMLTPELTIDGKPRGALSWAFARAVRGAADQDGDARLSQHELLAYLVPTVQAEAENQQIPGILPLRPDAKPIMRSVIGGEVAAATGDRSTVGLFVRGGVPADLGEIAGVEVVDTEADADLIWDRRAATVDHRIGGRVAEGVDDGEIAAILSKWSALAFIKARTGANPLALSVPTGNQTYGRGDLPEVAMDGARFPYLTMFNLPPDGRVELFLPANQAEADENWTGRHFAERFRVDRPPFGAEHMVAILTEKPAVALHEALRSMGTAETAGGLAATLRTTLADTPFQAGVVGIYTRGDL
jgi:hypothetical protein